MDSRIIELKLCCDISSAFNGMEKIIEKDVKKRE
jgi:hypothetical protein